PASLRLRSHPPFHLTKDLRGCIRQSWLFAHGATTGSLGKLSGTIPVGDSRSTAMQSLAEDFSMAAPNNYNHI
ncbi:MAG: hypothetical protein ACREBC_32190, partial [Pyrinomonadaceae bacterium]